MTAVSLFAWLPAIAVALVVLALAARGAWRRTRIVSTEASAPLESIGAAIEETPDGPRLRVTLRNEHTRIALTFDEREAYSLSNAMLNGAAALAKRAGHVNDPLPMGDAQS
jgi:hypothetical protein